MNANPRHTASLDALRGLLAVGVAAFHYLYFLLPHAWGNVTHLGYLCVSGFFALSAYLIPAALLRQQQVFPAWPAATHLGRYALHRLTRLLPAYYASLAIVALLLYPLLSRGDAALAAGAFWLQLGQHLLLGQFFTPAGSASFGLNGAYWTLTMELIWYALCPLLFLLLRSMRARYAALAALLALYFFYKLAVLGLSDATIAHYFGLPANDALAAFNHRVFLLRQFPAHLPFFIAGALLALWHASGRDVPLSGRQAFAASLLLLGPGWLWGDSTMAAPLNALVNVFNPLLQAAGFALLLNALLRIRTHQPRILTFLGRISYSLYLWHFPLLIIAQESGVASRMNGLAMLLLYGGELLLLATASYYLVEESGFRLRRRWEGKWFKGGAAENS
ncbi:MAG: acyltransferase [Sulfurimicrobium sp.]|nr:acyltransferase [Sulfurimicrobium sp.]MDP2199700.1 acyltransferase [Sulfurimicrobium sp.]